LSPSTTTLDDLLLLFWPDEKVALFRATFDGKEEAKNVHHTNRGHRLNYKKKLCTIHDFYTFNAKIHN